MSNQRSEGKSSYKRVNRNQMIVSRERRRYTEFVLSNPTFGKYYRVEQELGVPRATVRYWYLKRQTEHQDLHELACGGYRERTFRSWERPVIGKYIVEFLTAYPKSTLQTVADELSTCLSRNIHRKVFLNLIF